MCEDLWQQQPSSRWRASLFVQLCLFCSPISFSWLFLLAYMACWTIPTNRHTHRYFLYFKSHPGKPEHIQTFEKLMQAFSHRRLAGGGRWDVSSGAIRIRGLLSDCSNLTQKYSHCCTTLVTADVTLYYITISPKNILFAWSQRNSGEISAGCM